MVPELWYFRKDLGLSLPPRIRSPFVLVQYAFLLFVHLVQLDLSLQVRAWITHEGEC